MERLAFSELTASALDDAGVLAMLLKIPSKPDQRLLILNLNKAFEYRTGYSFGELVGTPVDDLKIVFNDGRANLADEATAPAPRDATLQTKDGKALRLEVYLSKKTDDKGEISYLTMLGRVVPATRPQDAEQLSQQLLANVFMSVGSAIGVLSQEGQFVTTNPALAALLGSSSKDLERRSLWDVIVPEERTRIIRKHGADFHDGNAFNFDALFLRPGMSPVPLRGSVTVCSIPKLKRFRVITFAEIGLNQSMTGATPENLVIAGQIQLVGLDEVKAALGPRWPAIAEKAMMTAEHIIAARLESGDVFTRTESQGFLIRFADGSEKQASSRAAKIAREIRERLIGQDTEFEGCAVTAITKSVELPEPEASGTRDSILGFLELRLNTQREEIERAARTELRNALAAATLESEKLFDRNGQPVPVVFVGLAEDLEERIVVAASSLPAAEFPDFELDIAALRLTLAAEAALGDIQQGRKGAYLVPVGFSLFNVRRHVEGFLRLCRPLQGSVRQRLMFVLSGIPRTVVQSRLQDIIKLLEPFSLGVGFEVASIADLPTNLSQFRIPLIVIDRLALIDSASRSAALFEKFVRRLQLSSSRLVARSVGNSDELKSVLELGVQMVSYARGVDPDIEKTVTVPPENLARERFEATTYAAAINSATSGIIVTDATSPDHPIVLCNPAFCALTGYSKDELVGRNPRMLQGANTDRSVIREMRDVLATGQGFRREILNYRKDGSTFWNDLVISPVRDRQGAIIAHVGLQTDVTERRRAEASGRRVTRMLQHISSTMPGFIYQRVLRPDGTVEYPYLSPSLARQIGAPAGRAVDIAMFFDSLHPDDRTRFDAELKQSVDGLTPLAAEFRLVAHDGSSRWIRAHAQPTRNDDGDIVWNGVALDITPEKSAADELSYVATHDPLTGLANRSHLQRRLEDCIRSVEASGRLMALMYIDISDFYAINDAFGASTGDRILKGIAERLSGLSEIDIVARIGGDEFAAVLLDKSSAGEFQKRASEVTRAISAPFSIDGKKLSIRVCAGVAVYPFSDYPGEALLPERAIAIAKAADVALTEAKSSGSGSVCLYSPDLDDRIRNKVALEQGLHEALEENQFDLHFQPIVDLETGHIVAAEALVRWRHPTLGLQRPDHFIPIAEVTGQIVPLGAWILQDALARLRK